MSAVHNSFDLVTDEPVTPDSGAHAAGVKELCTRAIGAVARAGRAVQWYMSGLMGDNAYQVYVAHQRRTHPDVPPMTERQFWRQKMDDQDRNPGARCC